MTYTLWPVALAMAFRASLCAQPAALPPLLPEAYEIALARSAAPPDLSDQADVYVLRRGGHVKVLSGTNGTACFVGRDHPESLYPICFDPEATRTVFPRQLEEQRLREAGLPEDAVEARIAQAYADGRLPLPTYGAIAYMMSRHQVIYTGANGRRVGAWYPHLMIYKPGLTPTSIGFDGLSNGDFSVRQPGMPNAHQLVITPSWATAAPLPPRQGRIIAEPGWLCPGDTYALRYEGPDGPPLRLVLTPETGPSETLAFADGLRLTATSETALEARDANRVVATDTLSIHPERMDHHFTRAASCSGRLSVASMAIAPSQASDRIRPRSVTNRGREPITLTHRGITVRLASGEETHAFDAVPFSGDWGVVVDTGPYNDACPRGTEAATAPQIEVIILTSCA